MRRLQRGRQTISKLEENNFVSRLSFILIAQFVDYEEVLLSEEIKGNARRSIVYKRVTRDYNLLINTLKESSKAAGNYFYLVNKERFSILLILGLGVKSL